MISQYFPLSVSPACSFPLFSSFSSAFSFWLSRHSLFPSRLSSFYLFFCNCFGHKIGKSGSPCLVPDLKGNVFLFSPLSMMLTVGLLYMDFVFEVDPSVPTFWRVYHQFSSVQFSSVQFSSGYKSCLTLCNHVNHSMLSLPVHHQLPESTQTHAHQVSDVIQSSHPLSSLSLPAPNPSQHQGLYQWVHSLHEVDKVLEFQLQGWSPLGWTGWICSQSMGLSSIFSNTTVQKHQVFSAQLSL